MLVTYDKDFGELNQRYRQPANYGVILFRIGNDVPTDETARLITQNINTQVEWGGHLWVIAIRKRPAAGWRQPRAANLLQSP